MMMKKLLSVVVLGLSALSCNVAMAHGAPQAKHGGVIATANDLGFELVVTADGAEIYVDDHGRAVDPANLKGKLTVLNGADKSEAELVAAGDKLEAKGIKLSPGAKAVAALMTPGAKAITVRFTVR